MISLVNSDARLTPIKDGSIHCIAFSPPYYGLRDYKTGVWEGGDADCDHVKTYNLKRDTSGGVGPGGRDKGTRGEQPHSSSSAIQYVGACPKCGATRIDNQLGQEELHDCQGWAKDEGGGCGTCYVCKIRLVMRQVRRILHPTGVVWLNLGDSYVRDPRRGIKFDPGDKTWMNNRQAFEQNMGQPIPPGLDEKNLYGIPFRVALALQADGWYWRSNLPWIKRNAMPESTADRPSSAHEYVLILSKSKIYYYDRYAVLKPSTYSSMTRARRGRSDEHKNIDGAPGQTPHSILKPKQNLNKKLGFVKRAKDEEVHPKQGYSQHREGREDRHGLFWRNFRTTDFFWDSLDRRIKDAEDYLAHLQDIKENGGFLADEEGNPLAFQINPKGYKGGHYAVWPRDLVYPMLKASTSAHGACPSCGNQWKRIVKKSTPVDRPDNPNPVIPYTANSGMTHGVGKSTLHKMVESHTTGWEATCKCGREDVVKPWIADLFVGSGTTLIAARELGLNGIGLDLSLEHLVQDAKKRLMIDKLDNFMKGQGEYIEDDFEDLPLFEGI